MFQIKIIIAVVSVLGLTGGGLYIKQLIGKNAVLEAEKAGLTQSITDANNRINDYAINVNTLREAFTNATVDEGDFNQKVDSHDYEKLARRKPDKLESVLNSAIASMWQDIREVTGYLPTTETTETNPRKPITRDSEGD